MKNERNVLIEAWYTPQIPLNIGPRGYGNLPGLIIELKQATLLYVAKEIVLNPKKKSVIKIPNHKIISEKEFNKMLTEFDRNKRKS
jgi:GLPGLI family protein